MRKALYTGLLFVALAAPLGAAQAKPQHHGPLSRIPSIRPLIVTYDVYVGGVHLIQADMHVSNQNGQYQTTVTAHSEGIWHDLYPWDTTLTSEGVTGRDRFIPQEFMTHEVAGEKLHGTKLHFRKDGDIVAEFEPPSVDTNHEPVTKAQKKGAYDPVSGLLQLLAHIAVEKSCDVSVPVFDGKILFTITGTDIGTAHVDDEDYAVYKGEARTCDANFKLVAGVWKDKIKSRFWRNQDDDKTRDPFHIWLASPAEGLPELPVRLETGGFWGLIVIHLSGWRYE